MSGKKSFKGSNKNPQVVTINEEDPNVTCNFCHRSAVDSLMWGQMFHMKKEGISVHYFCLLFSSALSQKGKEHEGILGFMPKDIQKELQRGAKLRCKYCRQINATIGCCVPQCKTSYHYSCGLENGTLFQFVDNFKSFCISHRSPIEICAPSPKILKESRECPICFMDLKEEAYPIKPPCCGNKNKIGIFHRKCIMKMAYTSGLHFFKCPLCNNKRNFRNAMKSSGIYVPDRDAAWELEPNAYEDLKILYNRCDAQPCQCPAGRLFNNENNKLSKWKIVRCGACGSSATHMKCGGLKNLTFRCDNCARILFGEAKFKKNIKEEPQDIDDNNNQKELENSDDTKSECGSSGSVVVTEVFGKRFKAVGVVLPEDDDDSDMDDSEYDAVTNAVVKNLMFKDLNSSNEIRKKQAPGPACKKNNNQSSSDRDESFVVSKQILQEKSHPLLLLKNKWHKIENLEQSKYQQINPSSSIPIQFEPEEISPFIISRKRKSDSILNSTAKLPRKDTLNLKMILGPQSKCPKCGKFIRNDNNLKCRNCGYQTVKSYKCTKCTEFFNDELNYIMHTSTLHPQAQTNAEKAKARNLLRYC